MATVTAQQVKALREKTGVGMGDCKKALVEAAGDEAKAVEILNKKFAGQLDKRADKEAANGRIGAHANGTSGALVELRCETDFVANNEDFRAAADDLAKLVVESGIVDVEQLAATAGSDGRTGKDIIAGAYGKLKENISLARAAIIGGGVACYVHHNGQNGTVLAADSTGGDSGRHICMHISAMKPAGLGRGDIAAAVVEEARGVMMEQAKGKPPEIAEKIVEGKMSKWFAERVLLEQPFAMDDKKSVGDVANEAGIDISGYITFELGGKSAS